MIIVNLFLFLAACAGHAALVVLSLNLFYSQPLPRRLLGALRALHGLTVIAGPLVFYLGFGFDLWATVSLAWDHPWRALLTAYTFCCCAVGLGLLPIISLWRMLRGKPAVIVSNDFWTVDVAARLGFKPIGRGKWRHACRLPGNEIFLVDFLDLELRLERLPAAWDGLTILHLSDLHLCGSPDRLFFNQVMDVCRSLEPDLVALTGDVVDSHRHHRWIVPILGRLRWRLAAFAVLGNHDYWHDPGLVRRRLRRLGMHVLDNCWQQIDVRGQPLVAIGHEGPWFQPAPDLSDCPPKTFRLCLSHTPDNIRWAQGHDIDLMLAGHNHGGQIRFPLVGSVFVPSRYSRRYDCGTFHEPPTVLHVSRGLSGKQPLRYNCKPQVTRIVLRARGRDNGR